MVENSGRSEAIPVRIYLNRKGLELGSDVGYMCFEGAMLVFVGERTSFRVHKGNVDTSWGIKITGPDGAELVLFIEPLTSGPRPDDPDAVRFIEWEKSEAEVVNEVFPPFLPQSLDGLGRSWPPYVPWLRLSARVPFFALMGTFVLDTEIPVWLWLAAGGLSIAVSIAILIKQRRTYAELNSPQAVA
jgi:hypothetical protein